MSTEKMREEFEMKWGYTNEEQGLIFIPGLNVYGCDLYDNADIASSKSSAWYYWQASRAAIEVELRDAYMKGWEASGEGWNHEHPGMAHETEQWQRQRDESLGIKP